MDPFFSKKDRPDASGLGMFISYSIVRNHGGEMTLDSAPGRGFRVLLVLPPAGPAQGASDPRPGPAGPAAP
jgi:two-component system NtrC family sensor kinase